MFFPIAIPPSPLILLFDKSRCFRFVQTAFDPIILAPLSPSLFSFKINFSRFFQVVFFPNPAPPSSPILFSAKLIFFKVFQLSFELIRIAPWSPISLARRSSSSRLVQALLWTSFPTPTSVMAFVLRIKIFNFFHEVFRLRISQLPQSIPFSAKLTANLSNCLTLQCYFLRFRSLSDSSNPFNAHLSNQLKPEFLIVKPAKHKLLTQLLSSLPWSICLHLWRLASFIHWRNC